MAVSKDISYFVGIACLVEIDYTLGQGMVSVENMVLLSDLRDGCGDGCTGI